jgi:flagellar hook-associated protein 3 FlgL
MRVTSSTLRSVFLDTLQASQQRLVTTQTQIATGKRINKPSDDPLGAARIADLDATLLRIGQHQDNAILARNHLGLEEETVAGVVDNLQRVFELSVQANNAPLSDADRGSIAAELRQRFDSILSLANTVNESGKYLFAGFSEQTVPFTETAGGVIYNGDQGSRSVQIGAERFITVTDSGSEVFERIANGNGTLVLAASGANTGTGVLGAGTVIDPATYIPDSYTITFTTAVDYEVRDSGAALIATGTVAPGQAITFPGVSIELDGEPAVGDVFSTTPSGNQDIFTTLSKLIAATEQQTGSAAQQAIVHNQIGQLLPELNQAVDHLIGVQGEIGSRLRAIDDEVSLNDGFALSLTETLSDIRDLDYAEAVSLLTQQLFGLEAAQQSYARIQGLSLFRFL